MLFSNIAIPLWMMLLSCGPPKKQSVSFIQAPFPNIEHFEAATHKDWLDLYFSTATTAELKENWSILFDTAYRNIRINPMISLIKRNPEPIILTGLLAHPETTNIERCIIGFYAQKYNIPINTDLLPKSLNTQQEKLYCSILHAGTYKDTQPLLKLLAYSELPLEKNFYTLLQQTSINTKVLNPIMEEKLRGEEGSFAYLSLFCTWFLMDPERVQAPLLEYLVQAQEDDRLEAMELLWGVKYALPIFQALENNETFSGVFAQLATTAAGGENLDFTLSYIHEGATWSLRLLGLEALGSWYAHQTEHKKRKRVRSELLDLIETNNEEVYIHLLKGLRMSKIKESITLISSKHSDNPLVKMEQAATLRVLTMDRP